MRAISSWKPAAGEYHITHKKTHRTKPGLSHAARAHRGRLRPANARSSARHQSDLRAILVMPIRPQRSLVPQRDVAGSRRPRRATPTCGCSIHPPCPPGMPLVLARMHGSNQSGEGEIRPAIEADLVTANGARRQLFYSTRSCAVLTKSLCLGESNRGLPRSARHTCYNKRMPQARQLTWSRELLDAALGRNPQLSPWRESNAENYACAGLQFRTTRELRPMASAHREVCGGRSEDGSRLR